EQFKPTKVAVEMVAGKNEDLNRRYKQYKAGTSDLDMNEIDQVGFRVASRFEHEQVYSVDWMGKSDMSYGEMEEWLKENQPALYNEIFDGLNFPELTADKHVLDYYRELNDPTFIHKLHKMYVNIARIGDFNNY